VYAHNLGAIRAYERAGFQHAGRLRGAKRIGRERVDVLLMDAVADDAEPGPLHALIAPTDEPRGSAD